MARCISPYIIRKNDKVQPVPCGKCMSCRNRTIAQWSFRLQKELEASDSAHFITLTYDSKHVPISEAGYKTLCVRDVQLFFKRLRKAHAATETKSVYVGASGGLTEYISDDRGCPVRPIKYLMVGEYGSRTYRPHYHIILFNAKLELIDQAWNLGRIHYGNVTEFSVRYCLKYMCKPPNFNKLPNDDRLRECRTMSRGLGLSYLTEEAIAFHRSDLQNNTYIVTKGGYRIGLPRYYKNRIYTPDELKDLGEYHEILMYDDWIKWENELFELYGVLSTQVKADMVKASYQRMAQRAHDRMLV